MLNFAEIFIEKNIFQVSEELVDINNVDIEHILIWNKYSIKKKCFKYFFGYTSHSDDDLKPLRIKSPKSNGSMKNFEEVEYLSFLLEEKHRDVFYCENIMR